MYNKSFQFSLQPPRPESLCTICYTSGTTGMPKGVMLTHENVVASMCSVTMQLGEHRPMKNDVMISFLPLAHMLERCCEVCVVVFSFSFIFMLPFRNYSRYHNHNHHHCWLFLVFLLKYKYHYE